MFPPSSGGTGLKSFSTGFPSAEDAVDLTGVASDRPIPPARPSRHVQHASQWSETKTLAPGLVVHSSVSQWSEFQETTEVVPTSERTVLRS